MKNAISLKLYWMNFVRDESAATAIAYSIIAALISVAAYVAMVDVGEATDAMFTKAVDAFPK